MYNIKTMNKIAEIGLSRFPADKYAVSDSAADPDAILVRSAKLHDMEFNASLLCISRAGAGTNNIPIDRCSENGVVVFNTPGANANAVKELALCALFLASRDIVGGIQWVKSIAASGDEIPALVEKGKSSYVGPELYGKALGVMGLGAIGARIANAALELGMKVYGYDPYLSVDAAWNLSSNVIHATSVNEIYEKCDYITIHIPHMPATHHFLNEEAFSRMRTGVRIINLARAELVDDDALCAAIDCGKVACYVTDFPNAKTADMPNVIAIPHLGASTPESEDNCAVMAVKEIIDYLENGNIRNSVNMAQAVMPSSGDARLCIFHQNIPEMIAKITTVISTRGVNIENMVNSAKKGSPYAYTLLELSEEPNAELLATLKDIGGVIRARVIPARAHH